MPIRQLPAPRWTIPGNSGRVAAGYHIYTYEPGTSIPKATYTDYTGSTPNPWPFILDIRGEYDVWWDGQYKVLAHTGDKDVDGALVWSHDNYGEGDEGVLIGNYNLVRNGSFEVATAGGNEPDNWTIVEYTSGTVERDGIEQIHGAYSLKFLSAGSGGGFATSDYFDVQESLTYAVNFDILSSVANIHNVVEVVWYTAAKAVISTTAVYNDETTNPTSWTYEQLEITVPANARFARVRVTGAKDDNANSGTCWFDNVSVIDIDSLYGYRFPNVNADVTSSDEELNILDGATLSTAELNGLDGLTASRAIATNGSGIVSASSVTSTELGYLSGVSSAVQTQLDAKQDEASAVSGYSLTESVQIEANYGSISSDITDFQVTSSVTTSTWESVGPTGSGADNIWTDLDDVPASAKAIIVNAESYFRLAATSTFTSASFSAYCANSSVSSPSTTYKKLCHKKAYVEASNGVDDSADTSDMFVPVTSGTFKIYWSSSVDSGSGSLLKSLYLKLVGWVE